MLDDLPVAARHLILANEQRFAVEHADPPVEIGRHELLREQQVGVLEQLVGQRLQRLEIVDLVHAARERAVGDLHHHRPTQALLGLGEVLVLRQHDGRRDGNAMGVHQFVEIDLVGAADHRLRIVDDRHPLLQRTAREAIGVIVDRGRGADEQAVEFGEFGELALGQQFNVDRIALGELLEIADRLDRGRRQRLFGVVQHGERIFGDGASARIAPVALGVLVQRAAKEFRLLGAELGERPRAQAVDLPALSRRDGHLDRRAAIPIEQQPAERLEARILGEAETEQQIEGRHLVGVGAARGEIERLLQVGQGVFVELVLAQFEHRLDGRNDAVPARLGQQRGVIALGLVIVGARQVDDLGAPAGREEFRPRQIVAGGDDLVRRIGVGKVAQMIDEYDPPVHSAPAGAASRRNAGSRSEAIMWTIGSLAER